MPFKVGVAAILNIDAFRYGFAVVAMLHEDSHSIEVLQQHFKEGKLVVLCVFLRTYRPKGVLALAFSCMVDEDRTAGFVKLILYPETIAELFAFCIGMV
jgi:hypothetical protein